MNKSILRRILAGAYLLHLAILPVSGDPTADNAALPALQGIEVKGDDIVLALSQLMPYDVKPISSPKRLVIEIPGVLYKARFGRKDVNGDLIRRVRGYQFKETPLITRVVVDLNSSVDYKTNANGNEVTISLSKSEIQEEAADKKPEGRRVSRSKKRDLIASLPREEITLDFEGADIRDVVRLMAETSNINIIFGPEVSGPISIHLKRVPFDEAFATIMNLKGLVASQLGANILRVTTPDILSRDRSKAVLYTKTIPINYLKADEMSRHIQSVMASSGRKGTITVADQSNSLVITDSDEGIAQAERLIAQLDQRPKQVMIEAKIVEINLSNGFDIGVQWEFAQHKIKADRASIVGQDQSTGARPRNPIPDPAGTGIVGAAGPRSGGTGVSLPSAAAAAAGISFGLVSGDTSISATLGALISQSRAKVLSAPKVVTINGQQASIEAVQDIRFKTSSVSNGVVSSDFRTVSAGIKLQVTPTINAEDRITLKIQPESSFPTQDSTEAGPIIRTRTAQTTVIVKDGDTLVIGGMIDDSDSKGVSKVPLLGDIPIIGVFFRSNTSAKQRNELLVFVTPRIVRD